MFDAVGGATQLRSVAVLKTGGILVSTQAVPLDSAVMEALTKKNVRGEVYYIQPKA